MGSRLGTKDSGSTPGLRKRPVYRIIKAQMAMTFFVSACCLIVDPVIAYSVLLGGTVVTLPGMVQAHYWSNKVVGARQILLGETVKIGLSALIFLLSFIWISPLDLGFLLGTFVMLQLFYVLVPLLEQRQQAKN